MAFARGKYAKAISDRSGMEFPYNEMLKEWNGMLVHKSEYEARHPQDQPRAYGAEGHGLRNARPGRTEKTVVGILGPNPFETIAAGSGIINVFEKSHGRFVVCDFVCPTKATRENFDADIVVWMDTIKEGRFEDTNKLFQNPDKVDFHITEWNEHNHDDVAKDILQ